MAEEDSIVSSVSSPTSTENHKRKFENLETPASDDSSVPPLSKVIMDPDSPKNEPEEEANGDAKRQRLENMVDETDAVVSQNGHQEDEKSGELEVEGIEQPDTAVDNDETVHEVQEHVNEDLKVGAEQPDNYEDKVLEAERAEVLVNTGIEEPVNNEVKVLETESAEVLVKIDTEAPSNNEDKVLETEIAEVPEQSKSEVEKYSGELADEGTVHSDEVQPVLETEITSRQMEVPNDKVGVLIGKAGDTIRSLQDNSGAKIQIMKDAEADPQSTSRPVELVGTLENIVRAEKLIKDVIAEADAGGSPSLVARGFNTVQAAGGGEQLELQVPIEKVGLIIGKGGETIRNLQTRSGARIQLIQQNQGEENQSRDRTVRVSGNKRQIEIATDMIKDVMNQTIRSSAFSSGYGQQSSRPQWGSRGPHHGQFSSYDYPQRAPQYPQNSHLLPTYGNYPPQQGPRSNFGTTWEQRPHQSTRGPSQHQANYNYGQQQGTDYGHHSQPYSQTPHQSYGHGYNEVKYDQHTSSQHYGHMGSQPIPYTQAGTHSGYGPHDPYGKPPMFGMPQQASHSYGPPRSNQPGTMPHQGNVASTQSYGQNAPTQQSYPYGSSGLMHQNYSSYGSGVSTDGYSQPPSSTSASGYPSQAGQPAAAYIQPGAQQPAAAYAQPSAAYPQPGPTGGYGSYPTLQPSYAEQTAVNSAGYGYQGVATDATYAQPSQTQPGYDQSGAYGSAPVAAGYAKSASPQAAYQQYDSSQAYAAHR